MINHAHNTRGFMVMTHNMLLILGTEITNRCTIACEFKGTCYKQYTYSVLGTEITKLT